MPSPVFFLLAGPNGAGKSTLYSASVADGLIPADIEFVNADLYEAAVLQHILDPLERSKKARLWADLRRNKLLQMGQSFVSETVFSHESKIELIREAQNLGFSVVLLVVCVDNPSHLLERVKRRVEEGGHYVPSTKILERYPRTIANLSIAVRLANLSILFDTSGSVKISVAAIQAPVQVAICRSEDIRILVEAIPVWAKKVLQLP